jgi:hypothetical protein
MLKKYIIQNLIAARQKSTLVWNAIPKTHYLWKPDENAMHLLESIRHVFTAQHWFYNLIISRGNVASFTMPVENIPFSKYTNQFMNFIENCSDEDFENININRTDKVFNMKLGDFLLRAAYHEATHTGQLLAYLRTLNIARPNIWDLS